MFVIQMINKQGDKSFFQYFTRISMVDFAVFSASDQFDFEDFIQAAIFREEKAALRALRDIIRMNAETGNYIGSTITVLPLAEMNA